MKYKRDKSTIRKWFCGLDTKDGNDKQTESNGFLTFKYEYSCIKQVFASVTSLRDVGRMRLSR